MKARERERDDMRADFPRESKEREKGVETHSHAHESECVTNTGAARAKKHETIKYMGMVI
jgi:hypothetical protein